MDQDLERFVRARSPALLRLGLVLTGDQHKAEDLVQAALEKAAANWKKVVRREQPEAYVRQIMYREHISNWRRRRLREDLASQVPDRAGADLYGHADLRLVLQEALRRLTPRQRAVLVLRYYEDRTEVETARVLGCAVGTVKSQAHLALRRLREANPELAMIITEETEHEPNPLR